MMEMVCMWVTLLFSLEHIHVNWLRDHTSWAPCGIGMLIRGILKSLFWILLHQGTLAILCSRIQGYMLSLMNEVNLCFVVSAVCFVWDAKPDFATKSTLSLRVMLTLGNGGPSRKGYKMRCLHPIEVEQHDNHISANIILTKFEYSVSSLVSGIFTNFSMNAIGNTGW